MSIRATYRRIRLSNLFNLLQLLCMEPANATPYATKVDCAGCKDWQRARGD
jgi:hypothetical protein